MINVNKLKEKLKKENQKLSSFFNIEEFKKKSDNELKLKIIDNVLSEYSNLNFEGDFDKYLNYINNINNFLNKEIYSKKKFKLNDLLGLHEVIMKSLPFEKIINIGNIRTTPSITRGRDLIKRARISSFCSPKKVFKYTNELIDEYNNHINDDSLTNIINMIIPLWINIHPFENGNGKVFYILLDSLLRKYGYWPIFLKHINNKKLFGELLEEYNQNKNLSEAKIKFYKIIYTIYSNYQIR